MIVSIHQPDFLPWLGFFRKILRSDRFVVFENVDTPQGKSWLTRNRILLNNEPRWITLPVHKATFLPINELRIASDKSFKRKHLGTIKQAYQKAAYFEEIFPILDDLYQKQCDRVVDFNYMIIESVLKLLRIRVEILWASELLPNSIGSKLKGNDMVLSLAKAAGATQYISGTGCTDFIKPKEFEKEGINFGYQDFVHPQYPQVGSPTSFISHMSVIDALFNIGSAGTLQLLSES